MRRVREHVDRAAAARARSRTRRAAPGRPRRGSSGCRRRRRSAPRRARPCDGAPCPRDRPAEDRRRRRPGLPASSTSSSSVWPDVAGEEAARSRSRSARRSRSRRRRTPRRSRGPRPRRHSPASARPIVPVPQYRSKTFSLPRSACELARELVQPLCHLGVRLEERARADAEPQPEELLLDRVLAPQELRRKVRLLGGRVVDRPVDRAHLREAPEDVDEVAGLEPLARRGHEQHERLARVAPLADDEVAEVAGRRSPGRTARGCSSRAQPRTASRTALPRSVVSRHSSIPTTSSQRPARWNPSSTPVLARRERVLELVPVAELRRGGDDRLERRLGEPPDPDERVANLLLLRRELRRRRRDPGTGSRRRRRSDGTARRRDRRSASRDCLRDAPPRTRASPSSPARAP